MTAPSLTHLRESLAFLHGAELRDLADQLALETRGKKLHLIVRIVHFLETGQKHVTPATPEASRAKKGSHPPLALNALMLKGAYKNDLKARLFFKQHLGEHFHFTAFGIDWLEERWMEGRPPTYKEFAEMWQAETMRRKAMPAAPKEEWAYIRFVQHFLKQHQNARREEIQIAWEKERERHKERVRQCLLLKL